MELPMQTLTTNYEILRCTLKMMTVHLARAIGRSAVGNSSTRQRLDLIQSIRHARSALRTQLSKTGSQQTVSDTQHPQQFTHESCISREFNAVR
jgi:hypothetical protein